MDNYNSIVESVKEPVLCSTALLADEAQVKATFPERFNGCSCHIAYPDQLHTFVGDCSTAEQIVTMVPNGDVRFLDGKWNGRCIIVATAETVSADYLDYLEAHQISYVFAGKDGHDYKEMSKHLLDDFGIKELNKI